MSKKYRVEGIRKVTEIKLCEYIVDEVPSGTRPEPYTPFGTGNRRLEV